MQIYAGYLDRVYNPKMPVSYNSLDKQKSRYTKKRPASVLTRAKYSAKSAKTNRALITGNAQDILALKRLIPPAIYCDYQNTGGYSPFITGAPAPFFNILVQPLMTPNLWAQVLRQDPNVEAASATMVKRMQLNLRYTLGEANWCQITTFVVSLRKDAADREVSEATLVSGKDYIYNGALEMQNARLNPAVFKVHYARNVSLMSNAWEQPKATAGDSVFAGNPETTYAKGQVNMDLNYKLRQPTGTRWRIMEQKQLEPQQRLFLLTFFKGQTKEVDDVGTKVVWDALYTTMNAS